MQLGNLLAPWGGCRPSEYRRWAARRTYSLRRRPSICRAKTRDLLFTDLDAGAGAWVPTGASVLAFDREGAEAAYLQFGRRDLGGNLAEDRRNADPAIVSTEMRVRTPSWPAL